MKKTLAFLLAAVMLAALLPLAGASAFDPWEDMPYELRAIDAYAVGIYGSIGVSGTDYDPSLDGNGILEGTVIYNCFDVDFSTFIVTPKEVPSSISGYTRVYSPGSMTAGTWCVLTVSGSPDYSYVLLMPATSGGTTGGGGATGGGGGGVDIPPIVEVPPELAAVGAVQSGVWPMDPGGYDPQLDGQGILNGTRIINCYEMDWTTFAITPLPVPSYISGYTRVYSPSSMTSYTWCVLTVGDVPAYSYVLLMDYAPASGGGGTPEPDPTPPPPPAASFDPWNDTPDELWEAYYYGYGYAGLWENLTPGDYDPMLDGQGILNGTHIYGVFEIDFATFTITPWIVPASISGYTRVYSPGRMTPGTWCELVVSGSPNYSYVLLMPSADGYSPPPDPGYDEPDYPDDEPPPEITYDFRVPQEIYDSIVAGGAAPDQTAFNGVWPYGQYAEPYNGTNYDGEINTIATTAGITEGALVFALYAFDFATFTVTPWGEGPERISGYTRVDNPGNLRPGEWTVVTAGGGWTYLFLVPTDGYVHLREGQVYNVGLPIAPGYAERDDKDGARDNRDDREYGGSGGSGNSGSSGGDIPWLWIGIGGGALVVVAVAAVLITVLVMKGKKKKP